MSRDEADHDSRRFGGRVKLQYDHIHYRRTKAILKVDNAQDALLGLLISRGKLLQLTYLLADLVVMNPSSLWPAIPGRVLSQGKDAKEIVQALE